MQGNKITLMTDCFFLLLSFWIVPCDQSFFSATPPTSYHASQGTFFQQPKKAKSQQAAKSRKKRA